MKTLKNIGWFVLAFLSFLMVYSFIQGVALLGLGAGVPSLWYSSTLYSISRRILFLRL